MTNGQYKRAYTKIIISDVQNGLLDTEMLQGIQQTFAAEPKRDPEYLASLNEALEHLLGPEEIVKRACDREGLPPKGEV